jgi:hypothetical protein
MKPWKHLIETDAEERAFLRTFNINNIRHWERFLQMANRTRKAAVYYFEDAPMMLFQIMNVDVARGTLTVLDPHDPPHTAETLPLTEWVGHWRRNRKDRGLGTLWDPTARKPDRKTTVIVRFADRRDEPRLRISRPTDD